MPVVNYLRISLIDRCNFRCQYCMPSEAELAWLQTSERLTDPELLTLIEEVFLPLGINRFRLTGGEPLLRPGLEQLIHTLCRLPGVEDVALTTNGFNLAQKAQPLYDAGLRRINISLDSLDADTFKQITGRDRWQQVWAGIQAAYQVGFDPLKLNVVVIPGVNEGEVEELAALTLERRWHVRFIEFMPIGNGPLFDQIGWVDSETLRQRIRARFGLEPGFVAGNGPADVFRIPGAQGTLGFISQMSECFCDRCNRMRLSSEGWLRPCLLNESGQINLRDPLRAGIPIEHLRQQVQDLLAIKPDIHFKGRDKGIQGAYRRTMSQIGG
ncbi:GTP 3',8-cyclase MoaA [Thermostichus vulcanus]|uniref:GTP 3',8-cyclase n=1 Tax=Thermostichus vulcanus str. 'Rupite' TaxID=2813851 RepID=A0ABT0CA64_THEVL|nr:GTP 3',8-cyclase MoaA [Thermostichus vulcanus]MCJ2542245.1 GTP 3',8-cyclase MoaA [Thermostichus vulcanus str. 'Rupite']